MDFVLTKYEIHESGAVQSSDVITDDVIEEIDFDESVGDEVYIECGDIVVETNTEIDMTPSYVGSPKFMFGLKIENNLFNMYTVEEDPDYDEKRGVYTYRLRPVLLHFINFLKTQSISYSSSPSDFNYNLETCYGELQMATILTSTGNYSDVNVYVHLLGELLSNCAGRQSSNNHFRVDTVTHDIPGAGEQNTPGLWKYVSKDITESEDVALDYNLGSLYWINIFEMALFSRNAFLKVVPKIEDKGSGDCLYLDIALVPRCSPGTSGAFTDSQATWLERKKKPKKYRIDGVKIDCSNYNYTQGDSDGETIVSRSISVSDPDILESDATDKIYFVDVDYQGGTDDYTQGEAYFRTDIISDNYSDMINAVDGYEGELLLELSTGAVLRVLDKLSFGSTTYVQIHKLSGDKSGICKVECMEIT